MDLEARVREAGAEALLHPPVAEATLFETVGECLSAVPIRVLEQSFVGSVTSAFCRESDSTDDRRSSDLRRA